MTTLTEEQQKTFNDLRKPTMSLIASFYETPAEIKAVFANMMAVYEARLAEENAKFVPEKDATPESIEEQKKQIQASVAKEISDKIMGKDSMADKKKWLHEAVATIPAEIRVAAKKKYIDERQAVPKGMPTSGMMLVEFNVVSKEEKDILMEAQAAARIIAHVDLLDKYEPKTNYQNADGTFENAFLDKPFATKIQRLEHVVNAVVNDVFTEVSENPKKFEGMKIALGTMDFAQTKESVIKNVCDNHLFLQKARNEALKVLMLSAQHLNAKKLQKAQEFKIAGNVVEAEKQQKAALEISNRINQMIDGLDVYKDIDKQIENARNERFKTLVEMIHSPDRNAVEKIHNAKIKQLENARRAKSSLRALDFNKLKRSVAGRPIEGLVEHRTNQILNRNVATLVKDKARA